MVSVLFVAKVGTLVESEKISIVGGSGGRGGGPLATPTHVKNAGKTLPLFKDLRRRSFGLDVLGHVQARKHPHTHTALLSVKLCGTAKDRPALPSFIVL